jgi:hypothetical protein
MKRPIPFAGALIGLLATADAALACQSVQRGRSRSAISRRESWRLFTA